MEKQQDSYFKDPLEYIRVRLYLMACLEEFEHLVEKRVHLYAEYGFAKAVCGKGEISRRNLGNCFRIARAKLRLMEGSGDKEVYQEIIADLEKIICKPLCVLEKNKRLLKQMLKKFR